MRKKGRRPEEQEKYTIVENVCNAYVEFAIFEWDDEVARGFIKWDNRSNWEFDQMSFAELKEMQEFHKVLEKCYEIASDKIKHWLTDEIIKSWGKNV